MGTWNPKAIRGYNAYHVISALQKAIRRGNVRLACYWAAELFESGFGPHV
jgi:replication-associated recombination protein RarA